METLSGTIRKLDVLRNAGIVFIGDPIPENTVPSEDGATLYCTVCGRPKYTSVRSHLCKGEYWTVTDGVGCNCDKERRLKAFDAEKAARIKEIYNQPKYLGVSKGYLADCMFDDEFYRNLPNHIKMPMKFIRSYCSDFKKNKNKGLYIYSLGPGLCKTSMVACAKNFLNEKGVGCILTNIAEITDAYQYDRELFASYVDVEALIIDDIGLQDPKELLPSAMGKINNALYELLNTRMLKKDCPTLFTSNYSIEELLERGFIPQTVDRIRGIVYANILMLSGPSLR